MVIARCYRISPGVAVVSCLLLAGCATSVADASLPAQSPAKPVAVQFRAGSRVCGQPVLYSPFSYDGSAGRYVSGKSGLPTYGSPGTDFPRDTAGVVLPRGTRSYASYQLHPRTVYYFLPGTYSGQFQADTNDAFVGGRSGGQGAVLTGNYRKSWNWAIDSNTTLGNQSGVTIEYLTIEKFQANANAAAVNLDANTGWTIRYDTITDNVPGAGAMVGTGGILAHDCLTLNGQYGFQTEDTDGYGRDSLTGGVYNLVIEDNEISRNDTCDFEGLLNNSALGWKNHNPVPSNWRNTHCGPVFPDGDQGGFKLWRTDGVTVSGNYIHNNWGVGGWADTDNANTTFTGNVIVSNDQAAIIEEISYNFSLTNNYIAGDDVVGGLGNPSFPAPAIYISESGSDRVFGGVPACPESACKDQGAYQHQSVISGNTLVDNGGNIFLWQNSNRYCGDGSDGVCTLVDGAAHGPFSISSCKSNWPTAAVNTSTYVGKQTGRPSEDWWDGCLWRTENVSVTDNTIDFTPAQVLDCNRTVWPDCGAGGIFSEYGSPPNHVPLWVVPTELTFFQGDVWSDNTYNGPSTIYAWNQGNGANPVSWQQWTGSVSGGDRCSSTSERQSGRCTGPFGQDAGSSHD